LGEFDGEDEELMLFFEFRGVEDEKTAVNSDFWRKFGRVTARVGEAVQN
jgi:hypothetical protein